MHELQTWIYSRQGVDPLFFVHFQCYTQCVQSHRSVSMELTEGDGPRHLCRTQCKYSVLFMGLFYFTFYTIKHGGMMEHHFSFTVRRQRVQTLYAECSFGVLLWIYHPSSLCWRPTRPWSGRECGGSWAVWLALPRLPSGRRAAIPSSPHSRYLDFTVGETTKRASWCLLSDNSGQSCYSAFISVEYPVSSSNCLNGAVLFSSTRWSSTPGTPPSFPGEAACWRYIRFVV